MAVYLDMSEADYHALDAISASQLKLIHSKSPAHWYYEYALGNSKDKPCYNEGRAIHCALLEPERFAKTYIVAPNYNGALKQKKTDGNEIGCLEHLRWLSEKANIPCNSTEKTNIKEIRQEIIVFERLISNCQIILQDDMNMITGIRDSFAKHAHIVDMLAGAKTEITLTWERESVPCKARIDLIGTDYIGELKSTTDASPKGFERQMFNLGYHISAAWYREGLNENGLPDLRNLPFKFFVAEKDAPNAVGIYQLDNESLHVGLLQANDAFARLVMCKQNNHYPDYGAYENIISVPQYIKNNYLGN
jgi:PDDEXK-like domain of unknown function (DUF3799)